MSYNDIFNRPYFVVPPECAQVQLLFDRVGNRVSAAAWTGEDPSTGELSFSVAVYFGTLVLHPDNPSVTEMAVRRALGFPADSTLRLDYACTADELYLLRAGQPGGDPFPFGAFAPEALAEAEGLIGAFLALDFRSILLGRRIEDIDVDYLFAGEDLFYEGFLGNDGLPLKREKLADGGACIINDTMFVTIP